MFDTDQCSGAETHQHVAEKLVAQLMGPPSQLFDAVALLAS
jgi:hypothetical protein